MLAKLFFRVPHSKDNFWVIAVSLAFGIAGIFFGISIIASVFGTGTFFSSPGAFFWRAFGLLSLVIPAFFLYAAFILADPRYKPDRIFILASIVFPFFTIALGIYWFREFDSLREISPFIARAGRTGIGFFAFFLVSIEVFIIIVLKALLFQGNSGNKAEVYARGIAGNVQKRAGGFAETCKHKLSELFKPQQDFNDTENEKNYVSMEEQAPAGTPVPEAAFSPKTAFSVETMVSGETVDSPPPRILPQSLNDIYTVSAAAMSPDKNVPPALTVNLPEKAQAAETAHLTETPPTAEMARMAEATPTMEALDPQTPLVHADVEKALAAAREESDFVNVSHSTASEGNVQREKKRRAPYFVPVEGLLKQYPDGQYWIIDDDTRNSALTLKETFKEFNIQIEVTGIRKGPVITMFEILPAPGIRLTKIEGLADNIALRLAAQSVRIVAPIPGKHAVGIEVPNAKRNLVSFREIIESELGQDGKKGEVPVVLGKDITGEAATIDLVQMPHLLIAGATGSGKSVCVNSMILSILYQKTPSECRLILIDPKIVELKLYNDIPHLLTPVITEPKRAFQALQYCIYEMERRYACLDGMGVRDIRSYNKRIKERNIATESMPYIVVVIDEFADLMATTGKELESTVARLAAMSRAVGIHLVLATQRPSIDVITGLIKANIPSRIAFMVAGRMNSQIIIDSPGAEKLLGRGDMLYASAVDPYPVRMQGAFVSEEEVERVVEHVKTLGEPDYIDDEMFFDDEDEDIDPSLFSDGDDPLYEKALEIVLQQGKASASYIQRRLKVGYNRAARLVELMEHNGVVGPAQGSKPRELLRGAALH